MTVSSPNAQVAGTPHSKTPVRGATVSRLRDSCHACALSKVKCHKEKPTCSRCARRGVTCEYFVTKRSGRKRPSDKIQNTKNDANSDTNHALKPAFTGGQDSWANTTSSTEYDTISRSNNYSSSIDFSPTTPTPFMSGIEISSSSSIYSGLLSPVEPYSSSTLLGMSNQFDDNFFTPPIDNLEEAPDFGFIQGRNDLDKLFILDDTNPDPISETSSIDHLSASKPSSPFSHGTAWSSSNTSVSGVSDSTCYCMNQALDLMKKLSYDSDDTPAISDAFLNSETQPQTIITENRQTIEAVSNMLQCSCAEDTYLMTILSMIIFKILDRYAAAVRKQQHGERIEGGGKSIRRTSTKEPLHQVSNFCLGDEDLARMAAQLILSELHHVQRLVNQFSPRLRSRELGGGVASNAGEIFSSKFSRGGGGQISSFSDSQAKTGPFSTTTLLQIEIDLRRGFSTLLLEIISMLRQS